ncbi:o-succinylbenzoate synthase [Natronoglomus mannanivorans]|uniref:o-succinylbenzoate synthase n=1 Tax=Natronoglomus mannanivorans TaxID=2979990 RepID=A0AAP2YZ27_9EURY|nr:o-succinylbenzoate synthase [Halobacteria archaeon AArc-xg1-1]
MIDASLTLEYRRFSLPLRTPLETAHGTIDSREGFLVRVTSTDDDEETTGIGEATPLPGWTESIDDCERALERAVRAIDTADDGNAVHAAIGEVDETSAARHGVSLALLDLEARRSATPLYRQLGTDERVARVPVNATVGNGSPEEAAESARAAVDRGFGCCKLKAGVRSVEEDLERVRRVREAVGPEVELRVDANGAWTYEEALTAVETFADDEVDVDLLEQPLPAGALEGHAELRGRGVAIALDEGLLEHGVDAIYEADAADAVVLKPMGIGGIDLAGELAAWVRELAIQPIVTTTIDAVVARTGAVHLAAAIPDVPACGLATADMLAEDLGRDPVPFERGAAVVPQAKGIGVDGVWDGPWRGDDGS